MGAPNVLGCEDFQFVEVPSALPSLSEHDLADPLKLDRIRSAGDRLRWMPQTPTKFEPIKDRSIYAFEVSGGATASLAVEYLADKDGKLRLVAGHKRRQQQVSVASKGEPVPHASLPRVRQDDQLRYAFVAIRGRLDVTAIRDMEDYLDRHKIFRWLNLKDESNFHVSGGKRYLPVIDPITIAISLSEAYDKALNDTYEYIVPYRDNPDREDVEIRARKLHLAKKINDSLLTDVNGNAKDPLEIRQYLSNNGNELTDYIRTEQGKIDKLDKARHEAANRVILCLESPLWAAVQGWHLKTPEAANEIGHMFIDGSFRTLDRMNETVYGRAYEEKLIAEMESNILGYLFHPAETEGPAAETYHGKFKIARKAATAMVIGYVEMAPTLIVHHRGSAAKKMVQVTLNYWTSQQVTAIVKVGRRGQITKILGLAEERNYLRVINYKVEARLKEWLEEDKAIWPENSKPGKASQLVNRIFICVEAVNALIKISEAFDAQTAQAGEDDEKVNTALEAGAGIMDFVVAMEDPIRAEAAELAAINSVAPPVHGVAAGHQAKSALTKLTGPLVFKAIGMTASIIDFVVYLREGHAYRHRGNKEVAVGKYVVAGGSGLMAIGYAIAIAGRAAAAVAATAVPALAFIVIGAAIASIGFIIVSYFSQSAWQRFAEHCCFGKKGADGLRPPVHGHETWSGGDFFEWAFDKEGLDRQIEVFTALLCSFRVAGSIDDYQRINVWFGAIPPGGKLHLAFSITYDSNLTKKPEYVVDLQSADDATPSGEATEPVFANRSFNEEGRLMSVNVTAQRFAEKVKSATCEVTLRYAPHSSRSSAATGTVPIEGGLKYTMVTNGRTHGNTLDSTDVEKEKKTANH